MNAVATTATLAEAEFTLSRTDFDRIRQLIYQRAGISLHEGKQAMVYSRLSRRLRETGHRDFGSYLQDLERGGTEAEWQEFVNCLTTNLTAFFREDHHFHALVDDLRARTGKPLRIWCNAASTGEEPYSLAMTVVETLGNAAPVAIVCSDIDTRVLATAQRGVYAADARGLSPERLKRHFLRGTGANEGLVSVRPELRAMARFGQLNLQSPAWPAQEPYDVIFCRNVVIYFDREFQKRLLARLADMLVPGGLLMVGHSESFPASHAGFRSCGRTAYERVGG